MSEDELLAALALGLMDLDAHKWSGPTDRTSLLPHYREDARRFLLPRIAVTRGRLAQDVLSVEDAAAAGFGGHVKNTGVGEPKRTRAQDALGYDEETA